jgi:AraC-like DNA-binding protein
VVRCLSTVLLSFCLVQSLNAKLITIDAIKAVVYGPERTDLITKSDVNRPGIDGALRTLEDRICERLMFQEAMRFQVVPDESTLDAYLKEIQREHDMSEEDLRTIFKQAGYSYAQGRTEFGRIKAVNQVMGVRVMSKLTVPQREIEEYYQAHPEYRQARYCLQHAIAPLQARASEREKDTLKAKLSKLLEDDIDGSKITWTDPYWLEHDEVAEDKQCIYDLEIEKISEVLEIDEGLLVFKLIDKHERCQVSIEERYPEIVNTLRQPKFVQRFAAYKQELYSNAAVIYF